MEGSLKNEERRTKNGRRRQRRLAFLVPVSFLLALLPSSGCRNCHLVEAELRTKEKENRQLRDEVDRLEGINDGLMHEMQALHSGTGATSSAKITPESASQTYMLKEVVLGRQTGGHDDDDAPGDEALQVVLEPRDPDSHAIKAPGALHVTVLEVNPQGIKMPLSSWEVPPDKLRRTWQNGLLSTGYYVVLPWKAWPTCNKLRVIVQFTLADGRVFEADKDFTIRLGKPDPRKMSPVPIEGIPLPPPVGEMPAPRKTDPEPQSENRTQRPNVVPTGDPLVEPATYWKPNGAKNTSTRPAGLLPPVPMMNR